VCDTIGAEGVEVRFLSGNGSQWLKARDKGDVEREYLAPMCSSCFRRMTADLVNAQAAEVERQAREDAKSAEDEARLGSLNGPRYREACAEHEDDLTAAEEMAAGWGVGNGLFGSRGE